MRRPATLVLLIIALAWQSFAAVASTIAAGGRADVVHSVMHWQEIPHHHGHHHDDGAGDEGGKLSGHEGQVNDAFHVDDSDDSRNHLSADHCGAPVLSTPERTTPFVPGESCPAEAIARPAPHPLLDGPFRPPRLTA